MASLETFDLFFDLPGETREQILGYLLIKPTGINIDQDTDPQGGHSARVHRWRLPNPLSESAPQDDDDQDYGPLWPLNYFLVSQTFNREATAVYFRNNTFHILCKPALKDWGRQSKFNRTMARSGDALLNNPAWTRSRRRIRHAVVYVRRARGQLDHDVFQPLLDMALAGGLKELEFRVAFGLQSAALSSPIMRTMYRVLTDPDLRVAKLSVAEKDHGSGWCAFHESVGGCDLSCSASGDKRARPGNGWISVDVAALIQQHGQVEDQLRILKIGD